MSEDPYVLKDENGNPLTSIFHKPPIRTIEIIWARKGGKSNALVDLIDALFNPEPIVDFHPDDIEMEED